MPEPHDFAVRICAVRLRASSSRTQRFCVHRIPPRVRDDSRSAPPIRGETGQADRGDLPDEESGIFLSRELDDPNHVETVEINRLKRNRTWPSFSSARAR